LARWKQYLFPGNVPHDNDNSSDIEDLEVASDGEDCDIEDDSCSSINNFIINELSDYSKDEADTSDSIESYEDDTIPPLYARFSARVHHIHMALSVWLTPIPTS
jgi:hypothetical protein